MKSIVKESFSSPGDTRHSWKTEPNRSLVHATSQSSSRVTMLGSWAMSRMCSSHFLVQQNPVSFPEAEGQNGHLGLIRDTGSGSNNESCR